MAPMVGAAIAAPLYWFVIEANHPQQPEKDTDEVGTVQDQRPVTPQIDYES